ncbi:MAG: hypothetical protein R3293_06460 [Candidatus Promineifilaceae bacterium]|nr:hypothetical protein [Candidatus Promineifilaceae bacterium]
MSEETVFKAEESAKLNSNPSWPAYLLIGTGAVLLIVYFTGIDLIELLWPGFIVTPGLLLMWPAYKSTADEQSKLAFLAVPGAMIVASAILLFAMNLTDHFEAMAYSWPLIIVAIPAAVMYVTRFDDSEVLNERAQKFMRVLFLLFLGLAFFFEIIIFKNFNPLMAIGLIAFGGYLLIRARNAKEFS